MRLLVSQQFEDLEELAALGTGFNVDFRQLSAESSKSELFQAMVGPMLISEARFGCHVDQRGETPGKKRTFALLDRNSPEMRWFGHIVGSNALLLFPAHGEIEVMSRPGFSVSTVSVPEVLLNSFFAASGLFGELGVPGPEEQIIKAPPKLLNGLRTLLQRVPRIVKSGRNLDAQGFQTLDLQDQILAYLAQIVGHDVASTPLVISDKRRKLNLILDYVDAHTDQAIRLSDLSEVAQLSERTLQGLFRCELGMTPKAYLMGQRLSAVHRELWRSEPWQTRVSVVANVRGFWHMGQFAADYRKLFGELPSTTLKRTVCSASHLTPTL